MLVRLMWVRSYNYDEFSHAHLAWLVSVGEVPYRDFAANHLPFFWILLAPLIRLLPQEPGTLLVLRAVALACNGVFIGCLGALICLEQPARQRLWAAACFGLVVFSPPVMHFLIEFRPDAPANALLFGGLLLWWLPGGRNKLVAFVSGICTGAALLINTKLGLFPLLLAAVALAAQGRDLRRVWPPALAACFGFGIAVLGGIVLMAVMKIPLDRAWEMAVLYNAAAERAQASGFGLAHALLRQPVCLGYVLAGLTAWAAGLLLQRRPPGALAVSILVFLVLELAMTHRPWKQYLGSWMLLAAYFPACGLPMLAARLGGNGRVGLAVCLLGLVAAEAAFTNMADPDGVRGIDRLTQERRIAWLLRHVPPDGYVVATFDLHPVFRRDTFFKVVSDIMPYKQDGLEQLMPSLAPGPYSGHFGRPGYDEDLRLRPPSLIMMRGLYSEAQIRAVVDYLNQTSSDYEQRTVPDSAVRVVVRRSADATGTD